MTTNKPMFVGGLTQTDSLVPSTSRSSRKTDTTAFADMLEARKAGTSPSSGPAQAATQNEQLQAEARTALNKMMGTDPLNGGGYKTHNISAMRQTLDATLAMPGQSAQKNQTGQRESFRQGQLAQNTAQGSRVDQSKEAAAQSAQSGSQARSDTKSGFAPQRGIALRSGSRRRSADNVAFGIALPDRARGIPLNSLQARNEATQNIALNRNRFGQTERSEIVSRMNRVPKIKTSKARLEGLGSLAAQYESGRDGIAAIGYDRVGGTSYGKYQIASRPGSMTGFLNFLDEEAPDISERLKSAGPANTGSRSGAMPDVWKQIAAEDPKRFEALQERFIHESHYEPALNAVSKIGYDVTTFSPAMKEVLWSTAVQHGPAGAANIFAQAADRVGLNGGGKAQLRQEPEIINEIYTLRADRFGSSTPQIQEAARRRMESERQQALALTNTRTTTRTYRT